MWQNNHFTDTSVPPFAQLEDLFKLSHFTSWPDAAGCNRLAKELGVKVPEFVCQSELENETAYYEQIIFEQGRVPTRPGSWHDLFNALVWMMFPQSKALLNHLHMEDIESAGLSPRTKRRNHITHFDECGIVIVSTDEKLPDMLAAHQWTDAFWHNRAQWSDNARAWVFGHANLEMLLDPFVGLTGKWLHLKVDQTYFAKSPAEQLAIADALLSDRIKKGVFSETRPLKPIPLLGIPGWCKDNQKIDYYANTDYFRPLRSK